MLRNEAPQPEAGFFLSAAGRLADKVLTSCKEGVGAGGKAGHSQ